MFTNLIKIYDAIKDQVIESVEICRKSDQYFMISAKFRDKFNYFKWINGVWLYSLFWATMPMVGWGQYSYDSSISACTIDWRHNNLSYKSFIIFYFLFGFLIPLLVIFFCYYNIVKRVRDGSAVNRGNAKLNGDDMWVKEKTVTVVSMLCLKGRPLGFNLTGSLTKCQRITIAMKWSQMKIIRILFRIIAVSAIFHLKWFEQ